MIKNSLPKTNVPFSCYERVLDLDDIFVRLEESSNVHNDDGNSEAPRSNFSHNVLKSIGRSRLICRIAKSYVL